MGPRASQDLRSPSPIMAPVETEGRLVSNRLGSLTSLSYFQRTGESLLRIACPLMTSPQLFIEITMRAARGEMAEFVAPKKLKMCFMWNCSG